MTQGAAVPRRFGTAWLAVAVMAVVLAVLQGCAQQPPSPRATLRPTAVGKGAAAAKRATAKAAKITAKIAARTGTAGQSAPSCPPLPTAGLNLNPAFPLPKPPAGSTITYGPPSVGCAYVVGYSDVRKLNGASLIGPGLIDVSIGNRIVVSFGANYFEEDSAAVFDYRPCPTCQYLHELPPAHATFLAFGFMPVSATLQLTEVGTMNIIGVGTLSSLSANTAWSLMNLRVYDVKVNGQPVAVGQHCQTARPVLIKLVGNGTGPQPYSLQGGGPLAGSVTIPPFTGCGVTEDLDPLLTGTVSGGGNYTKFTQGPLCTPVGDLGCPPTIPKPLR